MLKVEDQQKSHQKSGPEGQKRIAESEEALHECTSYKQCGSCEGQNWHFKRNVLQSYNPKTENAKIKFRKTDGSAVNGQ